VVLVPVDVLDGQVVALVGHELGAGLTLGALVDGALLGSYQELAVAQFGAEVEAGGCGLARDGGFLVLGRVYVGLLVLEVNHVDADLLVFRILLLQLQLHNHFALELGLHQTPRAEFAVRGDRLEALGVLLGVPADLPDRVVVFATLHAGSLLGLGELVADVVDQHGAVLAADAEHVGFVHVEVQTHDARVGGDLVLRLLVVLERLDLDVPDVLRLVLLRAD